jgi:hypothetical protein
VFVLDALVIAGFARLKRGGVVDLSGAQVGALGVLVAGDSSGAVVG